MDDIPLGHRRTELGLELRQAWLLNALLCNSEIWQKLTEKDTNDFNKIDHILLRSIVGSQSKAPVEQLYLETGSINISQTISIRRMTYLQTILQRSEGELIRRVYVAMKENPLEGDWCQLVEHYFREANLNISNDQIRQMDPTQYKKLIKSSVRDLAFIYFKERQAGHQKGRLLEHENLLKPQKYLITNQLTNKQISLLFNLRCQVVRGIQDNFHNQYVDRRCPLCKLETDSQGHIIQCSTLKKHMKWNQDIKYEHIYGNLQEQVTITLLHSTLLETRDRLLEEGSGLPGLQNSGLADNIL